MDDGFSIIFTDHELRINEYLESKHWRDVKKEALREYTECRLCGYTSNFLEVHHVLYESIMNDYLLLLGIQQTCRFQGKSFFKFLFSGEKDTDKFR